MMEDWKNKKDKIRKKFTCIIDRDLVYKVGKEIEMIEKLGAKLGKTKKELLNIIIEF